MTSSPDLAARPARCPTPVLFQYGFRPFFLLSGVTGCGLIAAWLGILITGAWPAGPVGAAAWHGHEMLFGTVVAAVAGFLLTAVPSWTGTKARSGAPLVALTALWLAGRVAVFPWSGVSEPVAALLDLAFLPALGVALAGPLFAAGKARNSAFLVLLGLLTLANLLIHLEWLGVLGNGIEPGLTLGLGVVLMMVTVIGGRILPAFTRNGLGPRGAAVRSWPWVEKAALLSTAALVLGELVLPAGLTLGALALAAALAHGVRLFGWRGWLAWRSPILWVLHLGYLWIPAALLLKALSAVTELPASSATHALTAGAFSTLILAVMSRASLGHTGRALVVTPVTVAAYLLLTVAALARVAAPLLPGEWMWPALQGAGLAWVVAFALYLVAYAPVLLAPRVDGRPG
ncbi:NnrS family protein [Azospirillum doebereinerae]|uniref:NnrS family protein n=1 Tax=Azospirillum doebereinerae TaxID=92933 RepID=A0A3S0V507_9PROT|nr:NnrS family protein [Azospirillum doebereinerae]RUQ68135.1 NnrS family protein [Azospirillum doebereinerae]